MNGPHDEPITSDVDDEPIALMPEEEAAIAKLAALNIAPIQPPPAEVRVQFRGATRAGNPAVELLIGDTRLHIDAKDMDLLASSITRLGVEGNTVVVWGYPIT